MKTHLFGAMALLISLAGPPATARGEERSSSGRAALSALLPIEVLRPDARFVAGAPPLDEFLRLGLVRPDDLGGAASAQFVPTREYRLRDGGMLRTYAQQLGAIPVEGGALSIRTDRAGTLGWSLGFAGRVESAWAAEPVLAREEAAQLALTYASSSVAPERLFPELVYLPVGEALLLAWRVELPLDLAKMEAPTLWLDAESGALLGRAERIRNARARVFPLNPADGETQEVELPEILPGAPGGEQHLVGEWIEAMNCVDEAASPLRFEGGRSCVPRHVASADRDGNFLHEPVMDQTSDEAKRDLFSEVSAYYHASLARAFFAALGAEGMTLTNTQPMPIVVNFRVARDEKSALRSYDNAMYYAGSKVKDPTSPFQTDVLAFGQSNRVDYAYDGDVIYHEFTHAVVGATSQLGMLFRGDNAMLGDPGSMNEAYADYFSAAMRGDPVVGAWSLGNRARDLSKRARCPDGIVGESHADSPIWSSALWHVRERLGAAFDQAVFNAMIGLPRGSFAMVTYEVGTSATLAEVERLMGAEARAQAEEIFAEHGLPGCADRVIDLTEPNATVALQYLFSSDYGVKPMPGYVQFRVRGLKGGEKLLLVTSVASESAKEDVTVAFKAGQNPIYLSTGKNGVVVGNWDERVTFDKWGYTYQVPDDSTEVHMLFLNEGGETLIGNLRVLLDAAPNAEDSTEERGSGGCGSAGSQSGLGGALFALLTFVLAVGQPRLARRP